MPLSLLGRSRDLLYSMRTIAGNPVLNVRHAKSKFLGVLITQGQQYEMRY